MPIITLVEGIITVSLNFKMAAPHFVNAMEENSFMKSTKDADKFGFLKSKI